MLTQFNQGIISFMDFLIGWTLHFPHLAILIFLGSCEAMILTLIPKFITNQNRLKRGNFDKKRLQQLIKEAKQKGDKEAVKRYRTTIGGITSMSLKAQGLPLIISLVPVLFIALWAFARIAYEPPQAGQNILIHAYFPTSQIGNLTSMVPQKGLEVLVPKDPSHPNTVDARDYVPATAGHEPWIQKITEDHDPDAGGKVVDGWATWVVRAQKPGDYTLQVRYQAQSVEKPLIVGDLRYETRVTPYTGGGIQSLEIAMPDYKPLGVIPNLPIPGLPFLSFPAWLVGYMIIVVPLAFIFKPLLRVY
jgi:uncharacterized membrane protein (DUF106 family)